VQDVSITYSYTLVDRLYEMLKLIGYRKLTISSVVMRPTKHNYVAGACHTKRGYLSENCKEKAIS
jgi:hypothetical protein